jgi:glutathione S-transferase
MQLFGSSTSPYVRRLCLWLSNDKYEFVNIDIFSEDGRKQLKALNPTLKIPMLKDDEQTLYDSGVIFRYLNEKYQRETRTWDDENTLTLVNAANDSFIELLLLSRSGVPEDSDLMFVKLQKERTAHTLQVLENKVKGGEFKYWNYNCISLFCLLDWVQFRQLCDMSQYGALTSFIEQHQEHPQVTQTNPRL